MISQTVCDNLLFLAERYKPTCPWIAGVWDDNKASMLIMTDPHQIDPIQTVTTDHEAAWLDIFKRVHSSKPRPKYLAWAGYTSVIGNTSGNPDHCVLAIARGDGTECVHYTARLKTCLCCFDQLVPAKSMLWLPPMLQKLIEYYRPPAVVPPAPIFPVRGRPVQDLLLKFSKN